LNAASVVRINLARNAVTTSASTLSGHCQESGDADRQSLTSNDPLRGRIVEIWPTLPVHVRYQVAEICLGAVESEGDAESA